MKAKQTNLTGKWASGHFHLEKIRHALCAAKGDYQR